MRTALAHWSGLWLVTVLLAGCQGEEAVDVRTTPKSLAWLAADHLGEPSRASADQDATEEFGTGAVGTEMAYPDGQQVVLAVGTGLPSAQYDCEGPEVEFLEGCELLDEGVLMWEAEVPESDPGVVYLVVPKGQTSVLMFASGPAITDDPRELDLPISVDDLLELALDPRVALTTTQEAVDGGRDIDYWREPDL